jgi:hypothetical protein
MFKASVMETVIEFVASKKIVLLDEKEGIPVTSRREKSILRHLNNANVVNIIEVNRCTGLCVPYS